MKNFEYMAPTAVITAAQALSDKWGVTETLMGGTDTSSLLKERLTTPTRVVSLNNIAELKGVSKAGKGVRIGSMTSLSKLMANKSVTDAYPSIVQAIDGINSMQHRAMSTVASDLLQRPRCWYFRNGFGLLGMQNGKSMIPTGENKYHAILGNKGPAYFVSASSLAPALIALGAQATLVGPEGSRKVSVEELYRIPSNENERETTIKANEVLSEVVIPAAAGANATYEIRERTLFDWPLSTASVSLEIKGGTVQEAMVVMGHVAPKPWRSSDAENALKGKKVSEAVAMEAGKAAVSAATPLSDNKHKVQLASIAVKRAVLKAAGMKVPA